MLAGPDRSSVSAQPKNGLFCWLLCTEGLDELEKHNIRDESPFLGAFGVDCGFSFVEVSRCGAAAADAKRYTISHRWWRLIKLPLRETEGSRLKGCIMAAPDPAQGRGSRHHCEGMCVVLCLFCQRA
jgi:hypothetical protein